MDPLLGTVTIVALTLAVGMSWLAVRLLRADRRRREARVAALEAAAWADDDETDGIDDAVDVAPGPSWLDAPAPDLALATREDVATGPMFAATDEPKAPPRRWLALATVVIVMAAAGGALYVTVKPAAVGATSTPATPAAPASGRVATADAAAANATPAPLELLSLKHAVTDDGLTVTGLVQNPRDGASRASVTAVVYVFDASGAFSASARAPIEFHDMHPGEESPFVVRVPHTGTISRYRVGFRDAEGRVIAHVDHRGQQPAGTTEGR